MGEADLNLAESSLDHEFKYLKLKLKKCNDDDAFIEVGMKAAEASLEKSKSGTKLQKTPSHGAEEPEGDVEDLM